jgi:hypothetical protein
VCTLSPHLLFCDIFQISYLSTGLGGDTLAAEYMLLFLLSKVYKSSPSPSLSFPLFFSSLPLLMFSHFSHIFPRELKTTRTHAMTISLLPSSHLPPSFLSFLSSHSLQIPAPRLTGTRQTLTELQHKQNEQTTRDPRPGPRPSPRHHHPQHVRRSRASLRLSLSHPRPSQQRCII